MQRGGHKRLPPQGEERACCVVALKVGGEMWRARQDSNPQPLGPKPSALSIELQALADEGTVARLPPVPCLGRATGFEPVISCATDRRLDHSATLATQFNAIK